MDAAAANIGQALIEHVQHPALVAARNEPVGSLSIDWVRADRLDDPKLRAVKAFLQSGGWVTLPNEDTPEAVTSEERAGDRESTTRRVSAQPVGP